PGYLGAMPDPGIIPDAGQHQFIGLLPHLLPFIEQNNVYEVMMNGTPADYLSTTSTYPAWWSFDGPWQAANMKIKTFLCPADDPYSNMAGTAIDMYTYRNPPDSDPTVPHFVTLNGDTVTPSDYPNLGRTNYIGVAGYSGMTGIPSYDIYSGVF